MEMYDLGEEPKKLEPVGAPDGPIYPCIYSVNLETYPPLKDMKLGDVGHAMVEFRISKNGGVELLAMGPMPDTVNPDKKEEVKKKLLKRHKTKDLSMSPQADETQGGSYV